MSGKLTGKAAVLPLPSVDVLSPAETVADTAFVHFYEAALPRIYAFIRSQVANRETAQEIVARIFLKAYKHRARLPANEEALIWAFRIAHSALVDHWRVEGRKEAVRVSIEELAELPDEADDPEALYLTRERKALLLRVMSDLGHDDRMLLGLKFAAQRTNREIGSILGLSEGAVSMRLLRALRRLRKRLEELGVS